MYLPKYRWLKACVRPRVESQHVPSPHAACLNYQTKLDSIWEWLCPFCSHSQVGSLKEPKPVSARWPDWELPWWSAKKTIFTSSALYSISLTNIAGWLWQPTEETDRGDLASWLCMWPSTQGGASNDVIRWVQCCLLVMPNMVLLHLLWNESSFFNGDQHSDP